MRLVKDQRARVCPDEVDQTGRAGGQSLDVAAQRDHDWAETPEEQRLGGIGGQAGMRLATGCRLEGCFSRIVYVAACCSVWFCET